jgi:Arc/MetJ-type ribon-helix-helix transcriptional regulator
VVIPVTPGASSLLAYGGMMNYHTNMPKAKVAVTLDSSTLERLDRLVKRALFINRSQAIEMAVEEKLARLEQRRLAEECARLDPAEEQALADLGWEADGEAWPEY